MLKVIYLNIVGWLRSFINKNTDIRQAGKEHIHEVNSRIQELRNRRNQVAARGINAEREMRNASNKADAAKAAVKEWNIRNDIARRDRAYQDYIAAENRRREMEQQYFIIMQQVADLDNSINRLESDSGKAEDNINFAAAQQEQGKAAESVENIHDLLRSGQLSDVIKESQERADLAEARRQSRVGSDNADIYNYQQSVPSMDDLLGNSKRAEVTVRDETVCQELPKPTDTSWQTRRSPDESQLSVRDMINHHETKNHRAHEETRHNDTTPSHNYSPSHSHHNDSHHSSDSSPSYSSDNGNSSSFD